MSTLNVKLLDRGQPIPYGPAEPRIRLAFGTGSVDAAQFQHYCDGQGTVSIELLPDGPYTLYPLAHGYAPFDLSVTLPHDDQLVLTLGSVPLVLSRLVRIDGHRMVNERGEKVYGRGADAFLLYKKFLEWDDITPVLAQLQGMGFNLIRVMGMFESLGGFNPKLYPDYYARIPAFLTACEGAGLYVLWTCCAATQGIFNTDSAVIAHIQKTVEQLRTSHNALASPVNEQGQHNNSINVARVKAEVDFGWMLHDMGSYGMDIPCQPPFGTHAVLHVNRRYSNSVRDCCVLDNPNYVNDHLQVGLDEPDRYGDEGNQSVGQSADAAGTAYTALFYVFHSMQGERGDLLRGNTLDCATAAITAMKGHG